VTRCQQCHQRDAIVHLTLAGNGLSVTLHLCDECAADRGIKSDLFNWTAGNPLAASGDLLAGWTAPDLELAACGGCGATLDDYRATRRLGCATCWVAFEPLLLELVRRFHGARIHHGPAYLGPGQGQDQRLGLELQRARIRAELADAVASEDFERAAALRDALRALETSG